MNVDEIVRTLDDVYFQQVHERETLANLGLLIRNGDHVLDIGGSLGQYPYFMNRAFSGLTITCVEADAMRFGELQRRCDQWTAEGRNTITAIHAAACDHDGTVTFYTTSSNVSGSIVDHDFEDRFKHLHELTAKGMQGYTAPVAPDVTPVEVRSVTLDTLCAETPPALVKVDVEGAEYDVIRGADRVLAQGVSRFLIEIDRRADNAAMFARFASHGYRSVRFFNHTVFYHPDRGRTVPRLTILARRIWYKLTRRWRRPAPAPSR